MTARKYENICVTGESKEDEMAGVGMGETVDALKWCGQGVGEITLRKGKEKYW